MSTEGGDVVQEAATMNVSDTARVAGRVVQIEHPDDPRVRDFTRLTDMSLRKLREPAEGLYMAESREVITRALDVGHRPRAFLMGQRWLPESLDILTRPEAGSVPIYVGAKEVLNSITGFHLHRGIIASMHRPTLPALDDVLREARRVAILEDIVDHTNVGAMLRSAAALGVDAVLVTPRCADPLYRRSVRVSMGTVFQIPWTRIDPWPDSLDLLRARGFTCAAMALRPDAISLDELAAAPPQRLALVLGTEGQGLTAASVDACDVVVQIPMDGGVDSLNVAAASAVAFWATRPTPTTPEGAS